MVELLGFAKKYLAQSEKLPKLATSRTLQADALKKCINYYNALGTAPLVGLEKPPAEPGSMDILMCFSDEEITEKEESDDFTWWRQFGKYRALQLLEKLKALQKLQL
tara:strand:+ start:91 stop:411 length:321 start_codon:yes stop_codon:yes gene_type:complete